MSRVVARGKVGTLASRLKPQMRKYINTPIRQQRERESDLPTIGVTTMLKGAYNHAVESWLSDIAKGLLCRLGCSCRAERRATMG